MEALYLTVFFDDAGGEKEIQQMPIELDLLDKLKGRVQLAKKIDVAQHKVKKQKHEENWLREAAEAMEIELDSDLCVPSSLLS